MRLALLNVLVVCFATTADAATTYLKLGDEVSDETVAPLVEAISNAPEDRGDAIILEINSPGGDVDAGFKLVKAIEGYAGKFVCIVDGEADSMASYIFVGCDVRAMTKRSIVMIHQPAVGSEGQLNDIQNTVDHLTAMGSAMAEYYAYHTAMSVAEVAAKIAGDRALWMDWKAAKKHGVVDIVVDRVADLTRIGAW